MAAAGGGEEKQMKAKTKLRGGGNCVDAANCFFKIGGWEARELIVSRRPICRGDNSPMFIIRLEEGSAI